MHLYAYNPVSRFSFREPVVYVGLQSVERNPSVPVPLGSRYLRAAEPSRAHYLYSLGAHAERRGDGLFHRPPERHPSLHLHGHVLGDKLRVQIRLSYLDYVHGDLFVLGERREFFFHYLYLGAPLAYHDAGPRRMHYDLYVIGRPLDLYLRYAGVIEFRLEESPYLQILVHEDRVILFSVPPGKPVLIYADSETCWIYLLAQN